MHLIPKSQVVIRVLQTSLTTYIFINGFEMESRKRAHSDSSDVIEVKDEEDEDCVEVQDLTQDTEDVQVMELSPIIIIVDDIPAPQPATPGAPERTIVEDPEPTIAAAPESGMEVALEPATAEAPERDIAEASEPTIVAVPEPTIVAVPEPTIVAVPEPTIVVTPEPSIVATPVPTIVATHEPSVTATPVPAIVAVPEAIIVATLEPSVVATPVPAIVAALEPAIVAAPEPAVVEDISVPDTIVVGKDDSLQECENAEVMDLGEPTPAPTLTAPEVSQEEGQTDGASIQITFKDRNVFDYYSDLVIELLSNFKELVGVKNESGLGIRYYQTPQRVDKATEQLNADISPQRRKRKRKKKKQDSDHAKDLFVVDTQPSYLTHSTKSMLQYQTLLSIEDDKDKETGGKPPPPAQSLCFNCAADHSLRDCPKPKDYNKINAARQKYRSNQPKYLRYHLEDEQRFGHLKPGRISEGLQKALGLHKSQLPSYIYRMRMLGYPPGWYEEAKNVSSELMVFDFEGKGNFEFNKRIQDSALPEIDVNRIVEYTGFNMPMEKGTRDEYRSFQCPPYSAEISKGNMVKAIHELERHNKTKLVENAEVCDMEIDQPSSENEINSKKDVITDNRQTGHGSSISPSLGELESQKEVLLEQLGENSGSNQLDGESMLQDDTLGPSFVTIDETGYDSSVQQREATSTPVRTPKLVKWKAFGTPILKSTSPYSIIPKQENFMVGVSDVINFENLPNSTGKYEQMTGVLAKVRTTMKNLSNS